MPMKIEYSSKCMPCQVSSSKKLKFAITCNEHHKNNGYSEYADIGNIAKVRLHFIQNVHALEIHVAIQQIEKDINVLVRGSSKTPKYFFEKILQDDLKWRNYIGSNMFYLCPGPITTVIFQFSITISAYKIKNIVHKKLYNDTEFTDFSLSTDEGTGSVPVHKALLAAHSDVFQAMLSKEWKETKEGCIRMEGITLQTLQQLKGYMYLGTLPDDDLLPLWSIASCYLIADLKAKCLLKLRHIIKPENFYSMLEYSIENKMAELTFAIIKATPEIVIQDAEKISNKKKVTEETEKQ